MRLKYADLAKRHDDVLAKYMGIQEENKILRKLQNTPSNEVSSQVLIEPGSPDLDQKLKIEF